MRCVGGQGVESLPVAELRERVALPGLDLAPVLLELDHRQQAAKGTEGAAGVDLRQLVMIADEHQLPVRSPDALGQLDELSRPDHRRLVEDDDAVTRQGMAPRAFEQCGEAGARDAGLALEPSRRPPRDGGADHRNAARLPRLPGGRERERLAGAGLADDDREGVAIAW